MNEPRYCLNPGCRKFGTCQSTENCWMSADYKHPLDKSSDPDEVMHLKRDAYFEASIGNRRNARRLRKKFERKANKR